MQISRIDGLSTATGTTRYQISWARTQVLQTPIGPILVFGSRRSYICTYINRIDRLSTAGTTRNQTRNQIPQIPVEPSIWYLGPGGHMQISTIDRLSTAGTTRNQILQIPIEPTIWYLGPGGHMYISTIERLHILCSTAYTTRYQIDKLGQGPRHYRLKQNQQLGTWAQKVEE